MTYKTVEVMRLQACNDYKHDTSWGILQNKYNIKLIKNTDPLMMIKK